MLIFDGGCAPCKYVMIIITDLQIPLQHVSASILVGHDEALGPGPIGPSRPEEGVAAVSVVDKVLDEQSVSVDRVNLAVHLMVVRIEFAQKFSFILRVLFFETVLPVART